MTYARMDIIQSLLDHPQTPINTYIKLVKSLNAELKKRGRVRASQFKTKLASDMIKVNLTYSEMVEIVNRTV
jgi:hypothetical protein